MPDTGDAEVREKRRKFENPQSLVDILKESADVKHFYKSKAELQKRLSIAYTKGLERVSTEDLADLLSLIDSVNRSEEYLADSLMAQARTAACGEQFDILSSAQVKIFSEPLKMTPHRFCIGSKGIDRDLSPWANWQNDRILYWEEAEGVYTAHVALIGLDASKHTSWIPYPVMRNNILLQGSAQAGKDFIKSIIVKHTKKGIFEPCGKSTEASQCDHERPHGIGRMKEYSETPVFLDRKHPRYAQEVQDKKTQFTECQHQYTKCERYMRADGTECQLSTNFKIFTDYATWVNTNDDMSIYFGPNGEVDMSMQAILSRFKHDPFATSNRNFGPTGDNRMHKSKKKGVNNAVFMAEAKFHRNSLQNDQFHATISIMVDLGVIPPVDFTVFDPVSAEVMRIIDKKGILITERMKQQVWNDAWVFAIDDWWAKNFMYTSGVFTYRDDGDDNEEKNVPIDLLVRHIRAHPIIVSEECTLFAWQMLLNSGSASQGVMNHIAVLVKHMVDSAFEPNAMNNKKMDSQTPHQKV